MKFRHFDVGASSIALSERFPWLERWLTRRLPPASRQQLDQRRIFILPSRVGVIFMAALLTMLIAAINYQNSLAYGLTFLLGSLYLVAILHTWRNLAGLVLNGGASAPVFEGEQACLRIRLDGERRAHHALALGWPGSALHAVDVAQGASSELDLYMPARRRGWLRPPRLRVESRYPLGIVVAWSWVDLDLATLVYPRPLAGDMPTTGSGDGPMDDPGAGLRRAGVDDYQGTRPWQVGESLRRLDWKAYSRGRGLLVKEFAALSGDRPQLDFNTLPGGVEERLSRLCHAVLTLSAANRCFELVMPDRHIGPASGEAHREACLRALALYGQAEERSA